MNHGMTPLKLDSNVSKNLDFSPLFQALQLSHLPKAVEVKVQLLSKPCRLTGAKQCCSLFFMCFFKCSSLVTKVCIEFLLPWYSISVLSASISASLCNFVCTGNCLQHHIFFWVWMNTPKHL